MMSELTEYLTCRKSLVKLLALLELGPGTSYRGHCWPAVNIVSASRIEYPCLWGYRTTASVTKVDPHP